MSHLIPCYWVRVLDKKIQEYYSHNGWRPLVREGVRQDCEEIVDLKDTPSRRHEFISEHPLVFWYRVCLGGVFDCLCLPAKENSIDLAQMLAEGGFGATSIMSLVWEPEIIAWAKAEAEAHREPEHGERGLTASRARP